MPDNRLSARETALIAQAKADLANRKEVPAGAQPGASAASIEPGRGTSAIDADPVDRLARDRTARNAPPAATAAAALDPAERAAALLAAARAQTASLRQRQRRLYLWAPVALLSVLGLWLLLWIWIGV